jgi:hypothetical protein
VIEQADEQLGLIVLAFAWPPTETDLLDFDELEHFAELAKLRLKRVL